MRTIGLILILLTNLTSYGQASEDSVAILSLTEVLELATNNHPIIRQANLQQGFAEAELRTARGAFDPKISSNYSTKNLRGTTYYQKFNNTLKIPVWFPIDPKVEVYRNEGTYLNPENYVSNYNNYWQVSAGVSVPIGKGLFIDERRALVKQAKFYGDLASAEQVKLTNKMLLTIIKSYWDWYLAYREYQLTSRSMEIAQTLFERVRMDYDFGEAAVIDTVQAKITYLTRKVDFQNAGLGLTQARLAMDIHLWGPDNIPLELQEEVIPTDEESIGIVPTDSSLSILSSWASENHPEIQKLGAKQQQLEVEQQWNRESLKPEVNLSYSLIDAPVDTEGFQSPQWDNNYKLGVDVSFPIFLRKERGKLQKTQLYLQQIDFDRMQLQQSIYASIESTFAELITNQQLVVEYQQIARNYELLLEAELFNLENGESDLFKINIQQDKYLESQVKYLKSFIKFQKLKATLPYEIGLPNLSYQKLYE